MFRIIALAALALFTPAAAQAQTQPVGRGMPTVAVPPLPTPKIEQTAAGQTHAIGLQVAEVIAADLRSTGLILALGPDNLRVYSYPEVTAPMFQQWRTVGASSLVTGFVQARADGRLTIGCYLYDVRERREIARKGFVVPVSDWRRAAHRCADAVYTGLTGKPGMFDTRIVYVAESGSPYQRQKRIAIMNGDGSDHRFLTNGTALAFNPSLSPDGRSVAYSTFAARVPQVRIVDLESGADRPLLAAAGMSFAPAFSPDGQRILLSMAANGNTDLYLLDLQSGIPQRLTSTPGVDTAGSFSPDGSKILFASDRSGSPQLYVMNADGSGQRRISFGGGRYGAPSWSPSGDLIAFSRGAGIGVMTSAGAEERMLTNNPADEGPSWSANGQNLLFHRFDRALGRTSLHSIAVTGGNITTIATPQGGSDASWSRGQE